MRPICTEDGTFLINDPDVGFMSARTLAELEAETRRRKAALLSPSPRGTTVTPQAKPATRVSSSAVAGAFPVRASA